MYINVKLLNGFSQSLTYKIPDDIDSNELMGSVIYVPLQKRVEAAFVEKIFHSLPANTTYNIREILNKDALPKDKFYLTFIKKLADYYCLEPLDLLKRVKNFLKEKEIHEIHGLKESNINNKIINLTQEQQYIIDSIFKILDEPKYYPALIHGVTGSGKTEIYKKLILKNFELNKTSILLLPEVSLAVQFTNILKKDLSGILPIFGFHSATGVKEKKDLWQYINNNMPVLIIGVHLPILLPISNLGLIIIDEEHESGFAEKKHPKINTKEAAILRAQITNIPIIMGSATPSVTSLYNVKNKNWNFFELKKRFAGAFPKIKLVKLSENKERKNFWISRELENAIKEKLEKKEQVIIFLNRRGYSFFIQCKSCGNIPSCINCSVSLTLHQDNNLYCHYCDHKEISLNYCKNCKAPEKELIKKGIGTQQIVTILKKLFINANIERLDLDTTVNKKKYQQIIQDFQANNINILVGTQTITKGYHFPNVTLVGILWADINLSLPFYNAAEITLQQIIQVAGRAGRETSDSLVIVQTMIDHTIYKYLEETTYPEFYNQEIINRQKVDYPPIIRLAQIELKNESAEIISKESEKLANKLDQIILDFNLKIKILGPAEPPVSKIKNSYIRIIYLKSNNIKDLSFLYKNINKKNYKSSIFFTPNPQN